MLNDLTTGAAGFLLETHIGQAVQAVRGSWLDEQGHLYLDTDPLSVEAVQQAVTTMESIQASSRRPLS